MLRIWLAAGVATLALAAAACGGGDGGSDVVPFPTLAGSPIPTVAVEPTATAVCDAPAAGEIPASFPADVILPPGAVPEQIVTEPHLTIVFRVDPPQADRQQPYAVLGDAMLDQLKLQGWTMILNQSADGADWDFTKPDGRRGHFNSIPYQGCADKGYAKLTLDLFWITP